MANNDVSIKSSLQQTLLVNKSSQSPAAQASSKQETEVTTKPIVERIIEKQEADKEGALQESREALQEKVAELNDYMQNLSRQLRFQVDEKSGDTVVQVIDSETDKLVRQIPSQEVLDVRDAIERYKGILLKEKA
jgi:flagellar protein FlaG